MNTEKNRILIGFNALNGKPVFLSDQDRSMHAHILGTTGAGKSKLMEHMIRRDIDNGSGLILLDPHGGLYLNSRDYLVLKRLYNRAILIDPNDEEWSVGINYLEYNPDLRSSTSHASEVMKGIAKVFGGEDTDIMPRLQRWERNALIPLIEKSLTVIELSTFVDPDRPFLRKIVLEEVENFEVQDEWERFDNAPRRDKESYVEAVYNRANKFAAGRNIRRMFGQVNSTVNFREAMDTGKIILCNLASNKLSEEEQRMLGIVILDKVIQAGMSRIDIPERKRRPFYVYLDEFGQLVSRDISKALQELRKFNVRLILAHQELEQLREDDRKVFSAVMAEPQVKMSFRTSREDAEIMMGELFTGRIRGDKEKRRIEQTKFWPVESTRVIETDSSSWSDVESETREGLSLDVIKSEGSIYGGGYSISEVPFYEQHPFREISSIQDYSIEEISEKYISWIKNQPDRHAQLKIRQNSTIPIITPLVKSCRVREKDIQAFKEKVYSRYALPAADVDKMIDERRRKFLEEAEALGLLEPSKPAKELTPESMRQSSPIIIDQKPVKKGK